jgi:hypothetical protein
MEHRNSNTENEESEMRDEWDSIGAGGNHTENVNTSSSADTTDFE